MLRFPLLKPICMRLFLCTYLEIYFLSAFNWFWIIVALQISLLCTLYIPAEMFCFLDLKSEVQFLLFHFTGARLCFCCPRDVFLLFVQLYLGC